jgi:hypothetical protein
MQEIAGWLEKLGMSKYPRPDDGQRSITVGEFELKGIRRPIAASNVLPAM